MSPEQLKILQHLSQLFEEGIAGPSQIKELSALLAEINKNKLHNELLSNVSLPHARSNSEMV